MIRSFFDALRARVDLYFLTAYRNLLPKAYTTSGAGPGSVPYAEKNRLVFAHMRIVERIRMGGVRRLELLQNLRLRKLLADSLRSSWWREHLTRKKASSVRGVGALERLPIVTRAQLREIPIERLLTGSIMDRDVVYSYTSGSTDGVPFSVVHERTPIDGASYLGVLLKEHGFPLERFSNRNFIIAVNLFNNRIADLPWNRSMVNCPIEWDSSDKREEGLRRFVAAAASMDQWVLFTHATELFLLTELLHDRGMVLKGLAACLVIGHQVEPETRRRAERDLRCPLVTVYGTREFGLTIAGACRNMRDRLHVVGEFMYLEILDETGKRVKPGRVGRVHLTGLNNTLMPLIRYDIGDEARIIDEPCGCPNPNTLIEIEDKATDVFVFGSEKILARRLFRVFVEESLATHVLAYQVAQEREDMLRVRIVLSKEARAKADEVFERVKKEIRTKRVVPDAVELIIESVDTLPVTKGKHKPFISLATFRASQKQ